MNELMLQMEEEGNEKTTSQQDGEREERGEHSDWRPRPSAPQEGAEKEQELRLSTQRGSCR